MKKLILKYPLATWMSIGYLIFIAILFIGIFLNRFAVFGEFGDALSMTFFLWPYPLVLALQTWINPSGINFLLFAYPLGLGLVIFFGFYLQRLLKISNESPYSHVWSILLFPIPLILLQVFVAGFVYFVLGLPIGE
ncbi:MAG: hypothetical protein G01um101430_58 [Parcubacteria group bacterium Gr01-1014_30]|nr:MAG: hypothetical protein G01um101430_58 [Parcubacteria group bacterium Gr01-1014_30]